MKNVFKTLYLLAVFVLLTFNSASAEKTDWSDKSYDFKKVKSVIVYDFTIHDEVLPNNVMIEVIRDDFWKNAERLKNVKMIPAKSEKPEIGKPIEGADLYVVSELLDWHDDSYTRPGYTTWENRTEKRHVRRSDGSTYEEDYRVTVPVTHPPRTIYTSTVRMMFSVFDAKTGKRVLARDDNRLRDDSQHGQRGMFGRITKSFFDDFKDKLRNDD